MSGSVVLLHGALRTKRCMARLARFLTKHDYRVHNIGYPSTRFTIGTIADKLQTPISQATNLGSTVHFVGYSMGGLVLRAYLAKYCPSNLGRVVMLGTPNQGSEVADYLKDWHLYRLLYGPAGQQLTTKEPYHAKLPPCELGIIAGDRSYDPIFGRKIPGTHDGKVSVESTKLEGMKDHIILPVCHTLMPENRIVHDQVLAFLKDGKFVQA